MAKKRRRRCVCDEMLDEIDRRIEQTMANNAAAFSESAAKYYDGAYAALHNLRDWLCR